VNRLHDRYRVWAHERSIYRAVVRNKLLHFHCGTVAALAHKTNAIYACACRSGRTVQGYFQFYALHLLSGPAYRRLRPVTMM